MGSVDETEERVATLSAKLLEGWVMLSESCPIKGCTVPLMRSREDSQVMRDAADGNLHRRTGR